MTEKSIVTEQRNNRGSTPGPKNRPWDRPRVELAMDVRSDERVVLFTDPSSTYDYPEHWFQPQSMHDADLDPYVVVIFDRMEVSKKHIVSCAINEVRMIGICPIDVDHEKQIRRMLTSLYPWTQVYEASTAFGKVLMLSPKGRPYDRNRITDDRPKASA